MRLDRNFLRRAINPSRDGEGAVAEIHANRPKRFLTVAALAGRSPVLLTVACRDVFGAENLTRTVARVHFIGGSGRATMAQAVRNPTCELQRFSA